MGKDIEQEAKKRYLFAPKSKQGLFKDYPELKEVDAVKNLPDDQIMFAWWMYCESSPLFNAQLSEADKAEIAVRLIFGEDEYKANKARYRNLYCIPSKHSKALKNAKEVFGGFRVGYRIKAALMHEKALANMEKIIDVDVNGEEFLERNKEGASTGERDWDKIKKYSDSALAILKTLPGIIQQAEAGFSIVEEEDTDTILKEGQSMIDKILEDELNK